MKHTNRNTKRFLCAAAVLLVLCTALFVGLAMATTANAVTHTLKVKLDEDNAARVENCYVVYYPNGVASGNPRTAVGTLENNVYTFEGITEGADVNLYVQTAPGWESDLSKNAYADATNSTGGKLKFEGIVTEGDTYRGTSLFTTSGYVGDHEFELAFGARSKYEVKFIGLGRGNQNYDFPSSYTPSEYYTFGTAYELPDGNSLTERSTGALLTEKAVFQGKWNIIPYRGSDEDRDGEIIGAALAQTGTYRIPEELADASGIDKTALAEAHKYRTIYVYPVFLGDPVEIWRDDYVMNSEGKILQKNGTFKEIEDPLTADRSNWYKLGDAKIVADREEKAGGIRLYTEKATGIGYYDDQEYKAGRVYRSYPGFEALENPALYRGYEKRILSENDRIVRFYQPKTYTVVMDHKNADGKVEVPYQYTKRCLVTPRPSSGYDFLGWEVTVTINDHTKTYTAEEAEFDGENGFITYTRDAEGRIKSAEIAGGRLYPGFASESSTILFTATWTPAKCKIEYDLDNVTEEADIEYNEKKLPDHFIFDSKNEGGFKRITIPVPARSGYTFDSWILYQKNEDGTLTERVRYLREFYANQYDADGNFMFGTDDHPYDIVLKPQWIANGYQVVLDPNDAATAVTTPIPGDASLGKTVYKFDAPFTLDRNLNPPLCTGYIFDGYYSKPEGGKKYINADCTAVEDVLFTEYETDENGKVVLYAHWTPRQFNVFFSTAAYDSIMGTGSILPKEVPSAAVNVFIQHKTSLGENLHSDKDDEWSEWEAVSGPRLYDFGTQFRFRIECPEGFKTVSLLEKTSGEMSARIHDNPFYTETLTLGAFPSEDGSIVGKAIDMHFGVRICPMISPLTEEEMEALEDSIDYINETVGGFPNNEAFRLMIGNAILEVTVKDGKIVETGETYAPIHNAFFGRDVEVYRRGDGVEWADSEARELYFNARPDAPSKDAFTIDSSLEDRLHTSLAEGAELDLSLYEFAVSASDNPTLLGRDVWQSEGRDLFRTGTGEEEIVRPGTAYYVFVRIKATTDAPHGEECILLAYPTAYEKYREERLAYLDNLLDEAFCGVSVEKLINATKVSVETVIAAIAASIEDGTADMSTVSVWRDVEAIIELFETDLVLAKHKDAAEKALNDFIADAELHSFYTDANLALLRGYVANVTPFIRESTSTEEVDSYLSGAWKDMTSVPRAAVISEDGTLRVESLRGLPYGSTLTLVRKDPIDAELLDSIRRAVNQGLIRSTAEEDDKAAKSLLSGLDAVAYYTFSLNRAVLKKGDSLTIRLTIPEDLRGESGLRVAYYDAVSGQLILLASDEVENDGDVLVFYADEIRDFVIFADATVDLTGFLVAMSILLLCQLAALAFLLMNFVRRQRAIKHRASAVLPAIALSIHFSPFGADVALLVMAILAILLQAAIFLLLWKLRPVYVGPLKKQRATDEGELDEELDEELDGEESDEGDLDGEQEDSYLEEDDGSAYEDIEPFDDEEETEVVYDDEELYVDEDDELLDGEEEPDRAAPTAGKIFISEEGEVFYGDEYSSAGMKEFNLGEEEPDEGEALFELHGEDEPYDDEESLYKYDE